MNGEEFSKEFAAMSEQMARTDARFAVRAAWLLVNFTREAIKGHEEAEIARGLKEDLEDLSSAVNGLSFDLRPPMPEKALGFTTMEELSAKLAQIPQCDTEGRCFTDFPKAIWRERGKRTKDARRGAWHCPQCGYPLALSFSDWGEPLWIPAKIEFTSASEFEKKILPATLEQNPTGQDAAPLSMFGFPILAKCFACYSWRHVPREAKRTGSKKEAHDV